jgi:REP element-mobilizing transposase RayT
VKYNSQARNRISTRLKGYDYSGEDLYHVVLRVRKPLCVFGEIVACELKLFPIGVIVEQCWKQIPAHFPNVRLDGWKSKLHGARRHSIVGLRLPNHIHGIIGLKSARDSSHSSQDLGNTKGDTSNIIVPRKDVQLNVPTKESSKTMSDISPKMGSLPVIVRTYKAAVTTRCRSDGLNAFEWQSRYYDHIIRDGTDLDRVRMYILNNPVNWESDEDNPRNTRMDPIHDESFGLSPID